VNQFSSGTKRNYYGKGDVTVYRLHRQGNHPAGESSVFAANVKMLIYGDAFWPTYTTGDNTGLVATDSMKNFIQRETLHFGGSDLESYCHFLAEKFLVTYPQAEGAQVSAVEIPHAFLPKSAVSFAPCGPDRAGAQVELRRNGPDLQLVEARSSITGFKLLRLGGSSFHGFVRDQYTTLPDIRNRPLHMWLDLDWMYTSPSAAFNKGAVVARVRKLVPEVFNGFDSGSIQQIIYQIGTKILCDIATIAEVRLEANNRTWDTVAEQGEEIGVYTDPRPPYGCLGLTLRR
jgi:urate oxidase / 2-oxo-4-hydroxy-4-carboxy-5-ureidoimidazoline decarboxylase